MTVQLRSHIDVGNYELELALSILGENLIHHFV